jgi:hypothetical protein
MLQEILTAFVVGCAILYLVYKLLLAPALRSRRPHVPASRLVRKIDRGPRSPS